MRHFRCAFLPLVFAIGCGRIGFDPSEPLTVTVASQPDGAVAVPLDAADGRPSGEGGTDASSDVSVDSPSASPCMPSSVMDYCSELPALRNAPVVDGMLDCGPALLPVTPVGWGGAAVGPDGGGVPAGNSWSIAIAWRPDGLYLFVAVTDPSRVPANASSKPFLGDAVEFYVDSDALFPNSPNYDKPGTVQLVVGAPADGSAPSRRGESYRSPVDNGPWISTQFASYVTMGGYAVEAFIAAADLGLSNWTLAAGQHVGIDMSVDVSYPTAGMTGVEEHRLGQYFLHLGAAPAGAPYLDVRSFCTPLLASL